MAHARPGTLHPGTRVGAPAAARHRLGRRARLALGAVAVVLALAALAAVAVEEPLRRTLERRVNAALDGYTATIGRVDVRWLGVGVDLHDVTVVQNALPDPPTVYLPRWSTSIQWRALLAGAIVADTSFERPELYLTFAQARAEAADPTPAHAHGWQEAVTAIHPLEINHLRIDDGKITYFDTGELPPLVVQGLTLRADDIRNVESEPGRYPSRVRAEATLGDGAQVTFRGRADFLAVPRPALKGRFAVDDLTLAPLEPALRHAGFEIAGGRLAARGRVEQTPTQLRADLEHVTLDGARVDYVLRRAEDRRALEEATVQAAAPEEAPAFRLDVAEAVVRDGTFAIADRQADPPYRVFLDRTSARVRHFSNQRAARRGSAVVDARFMGTGPLHLEASFAPGATRPDFAMDLRVEDVALPALNDVLRAAAGVDVVDGALSVYTELTVRDGRVDGYVKPLFRQVDVYDAAQDRDENPLRQAYEAIVGATAELLENRQRDEVATVTDLSGRIENPESSLWDTLVNLLRNAFVKAILPGLEGRRSGD